MGRLLLSTKRKGQLGDDCWLIAADCPEIINAIPLAMRELTDLDDITKTDKSTARIEQDVLDDVRYGLKTMLEPGSKPKQQIVAEEIKKLQEEGMDDHSLMIHSYRLSQDLADQEGDDDLPMGRDHGRIVRRN